MQPFWGIKNISFMNTKNNYFKMNKIAFITIYYGKKIPYLNLFLHSASKNPNFDFIIISDWENIPNYGSNILYKRISFKEFNKIAIVKKILRRPVKDYYKLNDLKPAWIHILEDFEILNKYEFIGYLDIDMILGNLDNFINYDKLKNLDLWTISKVLVSGAFTIYKNSGQMKMLYRKADGWQQIFDYPKNLAFDETLHMRGKYDLEGINLISFTELIYKEKEHGLRVKQEDNIVYEWYNNTIKYNNGHLIDSDNREYISYHYVKVKRHLWWYFPDWEFMPDCFFINKYGFSSKRLGALNLMKILIIPSYFRNAVKKARPYIPKLFYHLFHTNYKAIITTIIDKL